MAMIGILRVRNIIITDNEVCETEYEIGEDIKGTELDNRRAEKVFLMFDSRSFSLLVLSFRFYF